MNCFAGYGDFKRINGARSKPKRVGGLRGLVVRHADVLAAVTVGNRKPGTRDCANRPPVALLAFR